MDQIRDLLFTWRLSHMEQTLQLIQAENLSLSHLKDIEEPEINSLVETLPLKGRIEFKAGLAHWRMAYKRETCHITNQENYNEHLEKILQQSIKGSNLLRAKERPLNNSQQKDLTWLISNTFTTTGRPFKKSDGEFYAEEIRKLFPLEDPDVYFRVVKGRPQGKLFNRVKNGSIKDDKDCTEELNCDVEKILQPIVDIEDPTKTANLKTWLKFHKEPWPEVKEKWEQTHGLRRKHVNEMNSGEVYMEWPLLKHTNAPSLIDIDFELLYPGKGQNLFVKWDSAVPRLLSALDADLKDRQCRSLLEKVRNADSADANSDQTNSWIIRALHGILLPSHVTVSRKKRFKPTIADSQKAFHVELQDMAELNDEVEKIRNFAVEKGLKVQPFIYSTNTQFGVYFNNVHFKCDSFLCALDLCFKIFFVLNVEYPPQCIKLWRFLQYYFYDIQDEEDAATLALAGRIHF